MKQESVDLAFDKPAFFLWHYGTALLVELEAVEALDLFIDHIEMHDGTPFPLNHHPTLVGLIELGEIAIPRLQKALENTEDNERKRYAVFAIAQIGGRSARRALTRALSTEKDECVITFIKSSLDAFANTTRPGHITSEHRAHWYSTFLCKKK
jgi:hypothetical protein